MELKSVGSVYKIQLEKNSLDLSVISIPFYFHDRFLGSKTYKPSLIWPRSLFSYYDDHLREFFKSTLNCLFFDVYFFLVKPILLFNKYI